MPDVRARQRSRLCLAGPGAPGIEAKKFSALDGTPELSYTQSTCQDTLLMAYLPRDCGHVIFLRENVMSLYSTDQRCPRCQSPIIPGALTCGNCGLPLSGSQPTAY